MIYKTFNALYDLQNLYRIRRNNRTCLNVMIYKTFNATHTHTQIYIYIYIYIYYIPVLICKLD